MLKAVTYILENNATVQGLVGNKTVDGLESYHKIYPVVAPSEEKDTYCVCRVSGKAEISKGCDSYEYAIDVASYATTYDAITALNAAVISALTAQASGTINGVDFSYLNFVNESDGYDLDRRLFFKVTTFNGIGN
jgi:hypothetical protein